MQLRALYGTNRPPVVAVAGVVRAMVGRTEFEEPRAVVVDARGRNGRPVGASRTGMVERTLIAGADARKEDTGRGIRAFAFDDIPLDVIQLCPSPVTIANEVRKLLRSRHTPIATPMDVCRIMCRRENTVRRNPTFAL